MCQRHGRLATEQALHECFIREGAILVHQGELIGTEWFRRTFLHGVQGEFLDIESRGCRAHFERTVAALLVRQNDLEQQGIVRRPR